MAVVVFVLCLSELLWCGCADSTVANRLLASNLRRVYRALMPLWSVMLLVSMSRILIVEDEALIADSLSRLLGYAGHQVVGVAADGASALRELAKELCRKFF